MTSSIVGKLLLEKGSKDPNGSVILSLQKSYENRIEDEKLEAKARSALRAEKRQKMIQGYTPKPDSSTLNHEKRLRKIATKGVVQLFNAIRQQQKDLNINPKKISAASATPAAEKDSSMVKEKQGFIDMVKKSASKMVSDMMEDDNDLDDQGNEEEDLDEDDFDDDDDLDDDFSDD